MNAKSYRIFTGDKHLGNIEFMGEARTASHSNPLAIDPDNDLGFHALEAQANLASR